MSEPIEVTKDNNKEPRQAAERNNMKTLRETGIGETVRVIRLNGQGAGRRRIMDMGITRGTEVYVRTVAPLGVAIVCTVAVL